MVRGRRIVADYLLIGAIAAIVSFLVGFPVRRLAVNLGAIAMPGDRRIHQRPTPTIGGLAMFAGFALAMVVASQLSSFSGIFTSTSEPLAVVIAAVVMLGVGLADDLRDISAPAKLAGQVLAASVLSFLGVTMFFFKLPFAGVIVLSSTMAPLVDAIWLALIANAINLIDGLDGLAAGIVAIGSGAFFVYSFELAKAGQLPAHDLGPLVAVITCGVCLGFLPHNFSPARIFMGDTGAMLLGLLMAASTIVVGGRTTEVSGDTYFFFAPLLIPLVILGVPILDTVFAVLRRTARRASVATPDKDHLHHRLLRLGHGPRRAVVILWAWTALLSAMVLYPIFAHHGNAIVPFVLGALAIGLYTVFRPGNRHREEAVDAPAAPAPPELHRSHPVHGEVVDASVIRLDDLRRTGRAGASENRASSRAEQRSGDRRPTGRHGPPSAR